MTTVVKKYPWRVNTIFRRKKGAIALDQIRSIDKGRLIKKMGVLKSENIRQIKEVLHEMLIQ